MSKLRCHISISLDGSSPARTRARRTRSARAASGYERLAVFCPTVARFCPASADTRSLFSGK